MAHDPDSADNIISSFNFKLLHRFFWFTVYFNCFYFFIDRSSPSEVFLGKGVLKICSKLTGEHPCDSVIPIKLQSIFIEIKLWRGCSPVSLLHIFRKPSPKKPMAGWFWMELISWLTEVTLKYGFIYSQLKMITFKRTASKLHKTRHWKMSVNLSWNEKIYIWFFNSQSKRVHLNIYLAFGLRAKNV